MAMTTPPATPPPPVALLSADGRSPGVKLVVTAALALFMSLMALFIYAIVADRSGRSTEVKKDIESLSGDTATILGPVLVVPYTWMEGASQKSDVAIVAPLKGVTSAH